MTTDTDCLLNFLSALSFEALPDVVVTGTQELTLAWIGLGRYWQDAVHARHRYWNVGPKKWGPQVERLSV